MSWRSGRTWKSPKQSRRRMGVGRRRQLAQDRGESPSASRASIRAPASSRSWIVAVLPKAAARCRGVSPRVRVSRMKPPVSMSTLVVQLGFAPKERRTRRTRSWATRSVVQRTECRGDFPVSSADRFGSAAFSRRNCTKRQCPWEQAAPRPRSSSREVGVFTVRKQELQGGDVSVVGAVLEKGDAVTVGGAGWSACGEEIDDQICSAAGEFRDPLCGLSMRLPI